jgi:hypothetical protein
MLKTKFTMKQRKYNKANKQSFVKLVKENITQKSEDCL